MNASSERLPPLDPAALTAEQEAVYDEIVAGPRGSIAGPFDPWLRSPELALLAQRLGAFCRYRTSLRTIESETAILIVASHHKAQIEWVAHAPIALAAGLSEAAAEIIRDGGLPDLGDSRLSLVAEVVHALVHESRLSDALYARALQELGERSLVDLIGVVGYYSLVALTLNVFDPPIPGGAAKPFPNYS